MHEPSRVLKQGIVLLIISLYSKKGCLLLIPLTSFPLDEIKLPDFELTIIYLPSNI
ncbi:hypothetical protein OBA40_04530 [Alphaproteobacteria bacterium]|nr:hypothetical protein [Alphaproteobacteria bacterium]